LSFFVTVSSLYDYLIESGNLHALSPASVFSARWVYYTFLFCLNAAFFYFLFLSSRSAWFSLRLSPERNFRLLGLRIAGFAGIYSVIFLLLYLPNFPYLSSSDTLNQWQQIHGQLPYNRIHAIGHTILLKAILSIHDNYSAVIIFHIIAVILVYLLFSGYFHSKGIYFAAIAFVFSMALYSTCRFVPAYFYPWKDTAAAVCLSLICFGIIKSLENQRIGLVLSVIVGISLAGCTIFRLNGIIALIICGLYFVLSFIKRGYYKQLIAMIISMVLSFTLVNTYAERVLQPVEYENGFSIQVFGSGIAAMVKSGELNAEELEEIDKLISVDWMEENYESNIYKLPLIWYPDSCGEISENEELQLFNNKFVLDMGKNKWDIVSLYFRLMPRHFMVCVRDVLGSLQMMWSTSPVFLYSYAFVVLLLLYLSIKARLRLRDYAVFLPSACNTFSVMISTITNEKRYLLPTFMLMPVYFMYVLCKNRELNKNRQD